MRANSLALRLFLSATVWTALILLVTGFVLSSLYRNSVERVNDVTGERQGQKCPSCRGRKEAQRK